MNEKKIIKHLMMRIIEKTDKGMETLRKLDDDVEYLPAEVCFKDIKYYAKMIIED